MELFIVRHGQTDWNLTRRIQGSADIPLNEEGIRMAEKLAEELMDIRFDNVFSSPLIRAEKTAQIVIEKNICDIPIMIDKRISEYNFGICEGEILNNNNEKCKEIIKFFTKPEEYIPVEGAESFDEFTERTQAFLDDLIANYPNESRILIVAHGAMNKSILRQLKHLPLTQIWYGKVQPNCSVVRVVLDEKGEAVLIEEPEVG